MFFNYITETGAILGLFHRRIPDQVLYVDGLIYESLKRCNILKVIHTNTGPRTRSHIIIGIYENKWTGVILCWLSQCCQQWSFLNSEGEKFQVENTASPLLHWLWEHKFNLTISYLQPKYQEWGRVRKELKSIENNEPAQQSWPFERAVLYMTIWTKCPIVMIIPENIRPGVIMWWFYMAGMDQVHIFMVLHDNTGKKIV